MTEAQVRKALKKVIDPELGQNIVDLGLVYEIEILRQTRTSRGSRSTQDESSALKSLADEPNDVGTHIHITMTLTTPGCPLGGWFVEQVKQAVATGLKISEDEVVVEITFDPPWTQEMMTEDVRAELGF